jgi:hypothetical protein
LGFRLQSEVLASQEVSPKKDIAMEGQISHYGAVK